MTHTIPINKTTLLSEKKNTGVLERCDEEACGQRVHDHGTRLRREAARQGGVGVVPAHEPLHRRRGALCRGATLGWLYQKLCENMMCPCLCSTAHTAHVYLPFFYFGIPFDSDFRVTRLLDVTDNTNELVVVVLHGKRLAVQIAGTFFECFFNSCGACSTAVHAFRYFSSCNTLLNQVIIFFFSSFTIFSVRPARDPCF